MSDYISVAIIQVRKLTRLGDHRAAPESRRRCSVCFVVWCKNNDVKFENIDILKFLVEHFNTNNNKAGRYQKLYGIIGKINIQSSDS